MTSNESESQTFASFILIGKEINPEEITLELGITPSKGFKKGDKRSETDTWKHGYWELCSIGRVKTSDLGDHIRWVIEHLFPVRSKLSIILEDKDIRAGISSFSVLEKGQTVITLSPVLIRAIAELNLGIEFDLYAD